MGQELSTQANSQEPSLSILEPLSVSVTESPVSCAQRRAQLEEEQMERVIDPDLVRSIMAITEQPAGSPMPSIMRSDNDPELDRMRAEAERDFQQWKAARKLMRRLERHTSSSSTASSALSPLGPGKVPRESC